MRYDEMQCWEWNQMVAALPCCAVHPHLFDRIGAHVVALRMRVCLGRCADWPSLTMLGIPGLPGVYACHIQPPFESWNYINHKVQPM